MVQGSHPGLWKGPGAAALLLHGFAQRAPERVVKSSFQASKRSTSVIPAKAGIQNYLLLQNDLGMETLGFRLSPE
ncbi:MAG: hypothetical protein OXL37_05350 [Chloroflexota bacterium]|nr:hypothetical protein [Chloroflexota bacterium]MDE2958725.1 hypothetical protein [Chloroflexota bacterium]